MDHTEKILRIMRLEPPNWQDLNDLLWRLDSSTQGRMLEAWVRKNIPAEPTEMWEIEVISILTGIPLRSLMKEFSIEESEE